MTDDASGTKRRKRFDRFSRRDSAKSRTQDGSPKPGAVASSAISQKNPVLRPTEHAAPSITTVPPIQPSKTDASALLPVAVSSTRSDTVMHTSPNNTGVKTLVKISQKETSDQAAYVREDFVTDGSLWDKAYDTLNDEKHDLIAKYEDLVSRVLIRAYTKTPSVPNKIEDDGEATNQIPQHDAIARRAKMREITELGLKHMEDKRVCTTLLGHEIVLQDVAANVAGAVEWVEDYVKDAVQGLPYASIVLAGVSLVLPLLKNPTAVEAANREGFTYVTSQMRYYIAMESLLLPEDIAPNLKADLTDRLVGLYKLIIDFQVQSVLRFYRSRTKNFFRGTIKYDSWDKKIQDIKEGDAAFVSKLETAISGSSLRTLKKLARQAEDSRKALDGLLVKAQELIDVSRDHLGVTEKMDRRMSDAENRACLQDLQATDPRDDKDRIEQDKGGLLEDSYHWILENSDFQKWRDDQQSRLLWIKGDPGKGKTMLLCGIINKLMMSTSHNANLSFFFCQATDTRINTATAVLRGLLYLLVQQQQSLVSHIRESYDVSGKQLFEGPNAWVALSKIFTNILREPHLRDTYLIIDALDECTTDLSLLLKFVVQKSSVYSHVKWIVSSRNWPSIERDLENTMLKVRLCLELNEKSVSAGVTTYIQSKVDWLAKRNRYDNDTRNAVQRHLSLNATGTFLWVALVCQELANIPGWKAKSKLKVFPPGLDALYRRMKDQIWHSDDAELCKRILAIVSVVYRPVTLDELEAFVDMPDSVSGNYEALSEIIGLCGSFLTLRERTVSFVHQSAKDFLLKEATNEVFPSGIEDTHRLIFSRSLHVMSRTLRRDIYSLHSLGCPIEQVKQPDPDPLAASRYSCTYWVDHLCDWCSSPDADPKVDLQDGGTVDVFLRKTYLYWLEALSLCRSVSQGVLSIAKLDILTQGRSNASSLLELIRDTHRFIMYHKWAIENSPLQAYASALLFSPARSLMRGLFKEEELKMITIKPAMSDEWSACLQTLEGHGDWVTSVAFSHDSTRLASASEDKTVKIWDAGSGACLQTLEGHGHWVTSVAFSHDLTRLASASRDKTVKIWDAGSGACLQTLEGHGDWVNSVAFSHDSTRLASASGDKTVKIWDAGSGACLQTLEGHGDWVNSVAFSHDSTRLASASGDKTVKIWDAGSGACLQTLEGHGDWVNSVAFSHDSTRLASASDDKTVKIWDAGSGACLQTLEGHGDWVYSVAFSHDSTRLASASRDKTVKIWDAGSGACLQTLEGHGHWVNSVAFSHDSTRLASASGDKTVKIWDAGSGACLQTLEGHGDWVNSVAFSHDSTRLASASRDKTVKIWDAGSGACLQTLEGHGDWVTSVAFSHDSTRLASASRDKTVKIWDAGSGACLQTLEGHGDWVNSVAFSHDSTRLASASDDKTVKIWDAGSGACLQTLEGHGHWVTSVAFSHDSTRLASASRDKTVKIWDAGSGACLQTLEGHGDWVNSVAFSHDSTRLASASEDKTVKIWDAGSGACLQTLEGHGHWVNSVAFSHDSTRLASASRDKTVKIWDAGSGACLQTLGTGKALFQISFDTTSSYLRTEIGTITIDTSSAVSMGPSDSQKPRYKGVALSPDGVWITYDSDNLVRLPSEYRPSCSAVLGTTIGFGVGSGKVHICKYNCEVDDSQDC